MMVTAQQLIDLLRLERLPVEGVLFRQTYCSSDLLPVSALPPRYHAIAYASDKPAATAIYALFTDDPDCFSALHKLPTDEVWHFYLGDPIELLLLYEDGRSEHIVMGRELLHGQQVQVVVPQGVWMGAHLLPGGRYALIGNTMAPGFTSEDFVGAERQPLLERYPQEASLIRRLTRPNEPLVMPPGL
jgi:hypothetical protein